MSTNGTQALFWSIGSNFKIHHEREEQFDSIVGGKLIVFGGDFRQILPIISRGSKFDIVHATINSSYLCDHC